MVDGYGDGKRTMDGDDLVHFRHVDADASALPLKKQKIGPSRTEQRRNIRAGTYAREVSF